MAGKDWLTGFLERHPDLAKRKPQGLLQARYDGLNKIDVQNYCYLLEQLLKDLNLFNCPERIYNCDETGFPLNNTAQNHIIAKKGSNKEEESFKRRQIGFPNGIKVITTESGWKTEDAFLLWVQHFERFRAPVSSVLVLDGHISHKSLRALEFCEEKQIHSGFRTTRIYPFNPDVMQEHEYLPTLSSSSAPSTVTYNEDLNLPSHVSQQISESAEISSMTPIAGAPMWSDCNTRTVETPRHTTHKSFKSMTSESEASPTQSVVSFRDVLPSPAKGKNRKAQKT
ncbi:hypothetical protein ANN_03283 [Periplaneta americana]|uniref:Transposase n=1 Tax=Periplaneta americana TaxID=6978 RepID=A0ABQ8TYJ7_PERAM|nr:hypothetical protein ANN_03283 [Periplaneta americana]